MTFPEVAAQTQELNVRGLRKPDKHATIFAAYAALPVGGASFVLVNDHDPKHDEFEADHAGSYEWAYPNTEPRDWRIRITKLTGPPLPRILVNTTDLTAVDGPPEVTGAVWKLSVRDRDLDSNVIALPPDGIFDAPVGADLGVLIHVLSGAGRLTTERGVLDLRPGLLVRLPRRSRRQLTAGPDGLRYLTVHQCRPALTLDISRIGTGR